jgi:hypothetical protein
MMRRDRPDYVNYTNGSSFPTQGGGLYLARVLAVSGNNRVTVNVPSLSSKFGPLGCIETTALNRPATGDTVVVAFLENDLENMVVLGRISVSVDVFASKEALDQLTLDVAALEARVDALENP